MPLQPAPKLINTASASSEASGHWYGYRNGKWSPLYKEGGVVGMREARAYTKEGICAAPSVTTIFKDLHKGYLDNVWKLQMVSKEVVKQITEGVTPEQLLSDINDRQAFDAIKAKAFKETDDAATYGTAVHKALEEWFRDGTVDKEYADIVKQVEKEFQDHTWNVEHLELCVGNAELGYAGMCDVIGGWSDEEYPLVVDFKTRKTKPGQTPGLYGTDAMQIAAYGYAHFGEEFLEYGQGANVIISTTEPGRIYTRIHKDLNRHFLAFKGLCQYWRYSHNYQPAIV